MSVVFGPKALTPPALTRDAIASSTRPHSAASLFCGGEQRYGRRERERDREREIERERSREREREREIERERSREREREREIEIDL
jgi:hypothetical protein